MDQAETRTRRDHLSIIFARVSVALAVAELLLLFLILGLSFSSRTVSPYLSILYFLGEGVCAFVAIPLAIVSLRFGAASGPGKRALFVSIGLTCVCIFFMAFPG